MAGLLTAPTLVNEEFDFSKATADDVLCAFVVGMPFRFRVSNGYHCHFATREGDFDIWVRNRAIEESDVGMTVQSVRKAGGRLEDLWTTVAIIPNKGAVPDDELMAIQRCQGDLEAVSLSYNGQSGMAMRALNTFIVGYQTATGEMFGGHGLKQLTSHEYSDHLGMMVTLIGIPLDYWTRATIDELFNASGKRRFGPLPSTTGHLTDLPAERLAGIGKAIDRLETFYFYELAFEAKAKNISGDYIGALLMAIAALEGAHGAFVAHILKATLPSDRTGDDKTLDDAFIRELGFDLCNRLTPYMFLDASERPSRELIDKVKTGIKHRNAIMHASRDSRGKYKIRKVNNPQLIDAYSAALEMYDVYRKALETALSQVPCGQESGGAELGQTRAIGANEHAADRVPSGEPIRSRPQ